MASPVRFPEREAEEEQRRLLNSDDTLFESGRDKFIRKMSEQPIVPLGSLATVGALVVASHHLRVGNRAQFQKALRWRVGLQGLTVLGAVGGAVVLGTGGPASHSMPGRSSDAEANSDIATVPGRPATVHQASRAEEKREIERQQLQERLAQAEARQEAEQKRQAEAALLGGDAAPPRTRPTIGQDRRDRSLPR